MVEANGLYECNNTYQLMNYYHATLNYPVVSTLVKAIDKGCLKGVNDETEKGHMDQSWQGKRSTKVSTPLENQSAFPPNFKLIDTMEPLPQEPFNARTHIVFMTIIEVTGMLFSNQLGRITITSNRGNKYLVIFYIYIQCKFCNICPHQNTDKRRAPASIQVSVCLPYNTWIQTTTP